MPEILVSGVPLTIEGHDSDGYYASCRDGLIETDFLVAAFELFQPQDGLAIDIGANIGVTALVMAHLRPHGRVWALEPSPSTYEDLRRNVELAPELNVQTARVAISDRDGSAGWVQDPANSSSAHVDETGGGDGRGERVALRTLDGFVAEHGLRPSFLKVDVEGLEIEVFDGATATLNRDAPVVFVEFNSFTLTMYGRRSPRDLLEMVRERFGRVLWRTDDGKLAEITSDFTVKHLLHTQFTTGSPVHDLLCVPRGRDFDPADLVAKLGALRENRERPPPKAPDPVGPAPVASPPPPLPALQEENSALRDEVERLRTALDGVQRSRTWRLANGLRRWWPPLR